MKLKLETVIMKKRHQKLKIQDRTDQEENVKFHNVLMSICCINIAIQE